MVMVPVMLAAHARAGLDEIGKRDTSALRIIFLSGSQLGAGRSRVRAIEAFGPVRLQPVRLDRGRLRHDRDARGPRGRAGIGRQVVRGSIVKLIDEHGNEVPAGETGRIFVGNISQFEGYTGGGSKERSRG